MSQQGEIIKTQNAKNKTKQTKQKKKNRVSNLTQDERLHKFEQQANGMISYGMNDDVFI